MKVRRLLQYSFLFALFFQAHTGGVPAPPVFILFARFAPSGGKDKTMKISVYCERKDCAAVLEVPATECERWEERDYQRRLAAADDKSSVQRRSAQQIMDEDFNKPSFNRNQTETRRHVLLSALDPEERYFSGEDDIQAGLLIKEEYAELHRALEKLTQSQQELIRRVFWEETKQVEIAREQNVTESAIARRMERIYSALKKLLNP